MQIWKESFKYRRKFTPAIANVGKMWHHFEMDYVKNQINCKS